MQTISIHKSVRTEPSKSGSAPDAEALKKISRYTRREFQPEELYVFPVALCDNEIDRDGERFTSDALEKLAGLFVGKTGVCDHDPSAKNQAARLYECFVEHDPARRTAAGEEYARLVGRAYLPRTEGNADLIAALESGIRKEVSVGCAVRSVTCSVCGADLRGGSCEHTRGQTYGSIVCCAVLDDPSDAYEWSFVAVPAQREAGVLKSFGAAEGKAAVQKLRASSGPVTLGRAQAEALLSELARLEDEAACGREYRASLKKDFLRYGAVAQPDLPAESLSRAADFMGVQDLKSWGASFRKQAEKSIPLSPQLAGKTDQKQPDGNEPFRI